MKNSTVAFLLLILPLLTAAQITPGEVPDADALGISPSPVNSIDEIVYVIADIVYWVYVIFFIIAVLFILFAAFTYLGAGGDAAKVAKAKNMIVYAVIAIIVAFLAVGAELIVSNFLEDGGGGYGGNGYYGGSYSPGLSPSEEETLYGGSSPSNWEVSEGY